MSTGYSLKIMQKNNEADADILGVRLGRVCISQDVPAKTVAIRLGVSKQTIYNWFVGSRKPHSRYRLMMEALIAELG